MQLLVKHTERLCGAFSHCSKSAVHTNLHEECRWTQSVFESTGDIQNFFLLFYQRICSVSQFFWDSWSLQSFLHLWCYICLPVVSKLNFINIHFKWFLSFHRGKNIYMFCKSVLSIMAIFLQDLQFDPPWISASGLHPGLWWSIFALVFFNFALRTNPGFLCGIKNW